MTLNPIQKQILDVMYYEKRFMTAKEISTLTGYSWQTIEGHLRELKEKKFVESVKVKLQPDPNKKCTIKKYRTKWKFNYKHYEELMKKRGGI